MLICTEKIMELFSILNVNEIFVYFRSNANLPIKSRLIVSINRNSTIKEAETISELAISCYKQYNNVIVGIELSGDPNRHQFKDFVPSLTRARCAGLKVKYFLKNNYTSYNFSRYISRKCYRQRHFLLL